MNRKILLIYFVACLFNIQAFATDTQPPKFNIDHKFIINKGQVSEGINTPADIKYYVQRGLMTVYFLEDRVSYVLRKIGDENVTHSRIDLDFGSTLTPKIYGVGERKSNIKFYSNNCPEGLRAGDYEKVVYEGVYENIDLVYYFDDKGSMKYDFIVHPGGNPDDIQLSFDGNIGLNIAEDGKLIVKSTAGEISEAAPFTYMRGSKEEVSSEFFLNKTNNKIGFKIGDYNTTETLVIDPEVKWSTFYGGESFDDGNGSTVDEDGNFYVTGQTYSLEFPNISSEYSNGEKGDVVIGKFSPSGDHLWSIYYGGDDISKGMGITVDDNGNVYVAGVTKSKYLPNPQNINNPLEASGNDDILIIKVQSDGDPLMVRTYGSFNGKDQAEDIAYNAGGLYVTGHTSTSETEFVNLFMGTEHQPVKAADVDAFLMRIDVDMNPEWFTYLGGNGGDEAYGLTVDASGNPYITGATSSNNLPTSGNAFSPGPSAEETDVFIAKFNQLDGTLLWLNYVGGTRKDIGNDLAAFDDEIIYVVGATASTPADGFEIIGNDTLRSEQSDFEGGIFDAFILRVNAATGLIVWSTYLGGEGDDRANAVTTTQGAEAIVTGFTESSNFPTENSDDAVRGSFQGGEEDAFLSVFSDAGDLRYSGHIGGGNTDIGKDVSFHRGTQSVYIVGRTRSADFPTVDAYQPNYQGGGDIFIYTLGTAIEPGPTDPTDPDPDNPDGSIFCDNVTNNVISRNPLFAGGCIDQTSDTEVFFYGTVPVIVGDDKRFSYQYQIYINGEYVNIPGATGRHLTVGDIDLSQYEPDDYQIRRLVFTALCVDPSSTEVLSYDSFEFAFPDFNVVANCAGEDIQLVNDSRISGTAITSYTYTVTSNGNVDVYNGTGNPTINIGALPEGNAMIELEITSDEGCMGTITRNIEVGQAPEANFTYENDVICLDYPYQFTSTSTSDAADPIVTYAWNFGGGMTSSEANPVIEFNQSGAKTVTLTITTQNGCSDEFTRTFSANQVVPAPTVDAGVDQTINEGTTLALNPTVSFPSTPVQQSLGSVLWTSNPTGAFDAPGLNPDRLYAGAKPTEDSYLKIRVTSNLGCVAEDSLEVIVNPAEGGGENIPDLFTPNNDGYNDEFIIPFLEGIPEARVQIFNRWGSMVYNTTNYAANPWDGSYDGEPAPAGIYFYIITFPDDRNDIEGTVTLLR